MLPYVDGYVVPVPAQAKEKYIALAKTMAAVFKKHGALKVVECWGDDVPEGKVTSFPMAVKTTKDECVVFSWITWPSKAVRDLGMKNVMADPTFEGVDMAFLDGQRMIMGGFQTIVEL